MNDEIYKQEVDQEKTKDVPPEHFEEGTRVKMGGHVPESMKQAMRLAKKDREEAAGIQGNSPKNNKTASNDGYNPKPRLQGSRELEDLMASLTDQANVYDEIKLPSLGMFYSGSDGPTDGVLNLRPMTGEEEQILITPRWSRNGVSVNMVLQRCLQQKGFKPEEFLTIDRTYLLVHLRIVSFGHEYEVEIKCPECDHKFPTTIDLNKLNYNECPKDFRPPLSDKLPKTGFRVNYRLSKGRDEQTIQEYRQNQVRMFGEGATDDTVHYRTALLIDDIEGVNDNREIITLLKKLPVQDVAYLRSIINDPPFGMDTKCHIECALCPASFEIDLPLETNFFFPKLKRKKDRA